MQTPTLELADIHNHLIPMVDDGARTYEESFRHLRDWAADGVTRVAVTPHLNGKIALLPGDEPERRYGELKAAFDALVAEAESEVGLPELIFGQETYMPTLEIAEALLKSGVPFGYSGTRYALIEFGFRAPDAVTETIRLVASSGRIPVVGHPERYRRADASMGLDEIATWKDAGAVLQVNGGSIVGDYGDSVEALGWELIRLGWADCLGSDSHADHRPLSMRDVVEALRGRGADVARLMSDNPQRLLRDDDLLPVEGLEEGRRRAG